MNKKINYVKYTYMYIIKNYFFYHYMENLMIRHSYFEYFNKKKTDLQDIRPLIKLMFSNIIVNHHILPKIRKILVISLCIPKILQIP